MPLGLAVISVLSIQIIMDSRWGYYFVSIREDQDAAESLGINTHYYKMVSLNIAAFLTGMAGALYMNYMGFIDPEVVFSLHDISIMGDPGGNCGRGRHHLRSRGGGICHGGGSMSFSGPGSSDFFKGLAAVTGSDAVTVFAKYVSQAHVLGFGILVVLVILLLPNGIVGDWSKIISKLSPFKKKEVVG